MLDCHANGRGYFQAYGPGIVMIIVCEAPVIVFRYIALNKWIISNHSIRIL